jgi:hypothetical protein
MTKGKCVGSFTSTDFEAYYKMSKVEIYFTNEWLRVFTHDHNYYDILVDWYEEGRTFKALRSKPFPTIHLKVRIHMGTQLVSRIYGEKYATHVRIGWVPMMYEITEGGKIFNWVTILSNSLAEAIGKAQLDAFSGTLEFYMSSYLLDVVCASNTFMGLGWSWSPKNPLFMSISRTYGRTCINFSFPYL